MSQHSFSGAKLRALRRELGWKPERLALAIDRTVYTVHEYERGRAVPSLNSLCALADVLDCPLADLFDEEVSAHVA